MYNYIYLYVSTFSNDLFVVLLIVYYAPREEKTWTVHSSCELTPEPKARSVYYFSSHRGRKCHISVSETGGNEALTARCEEKYIFIFL